MNDIIDIVGKKNFAEQIISNEPIIVDFWAVWCNPCRMQAPVLADLKKQLGDKIKILKVNVDEEENQGIVREHGIVSIPTLVIYAKGELKEKIVGLTSGAELKEIAEKYSV